MAKKVINGGLGEKYSLTGVRAFIPRGSKSRKAILDYVCGTDSYDRSLKDRTGSSGNWMLF